MKDPEYINERLSDHLKDQEIKRNYNKLINFVIASEDIGAKYNLLCLLMNHGTNSLCIENFSKQIRSIYCSDKNIESYLNNIIQWNPKLGYVSFEASTRSNINGDSSLYITIPVNDVDEAEREMKRIKEVLTMILMESKCLANE